MRGSSGLSTMTGATAIQLTIARPADRSTVTARHSCWLQHVIPPAARSGVATARCALAFAVPAAFDVGRGAGGPHGFTTATARSATTATAATRVDRPGRASFVTMTSAVADARSASAGAGPARSARTRATGTRFVRTGRGSLIGATSCRAPALAGWGGRVYARPRVLRSRRDTPCARTRSRAVRRPARRGQRGRFAARSPGSRCSAPAARSARPGGSWCPAH